MSLINLVSRIFIADPRHPEAEEDPGYALMRMLVFVWFMVSIGLVGVLLPGIAHLIQGRYIDAFIAVTTGAFVAGASTAIGSFVGFLFGVPRATTQASDDGKGRARNRRMYLPNTNLEQISDWLTKIIVGVGLVEIRSVVAWFDQIGVLAGPAIWPDPAGRSIVVAILVHNMLMGFFQGFLVAYMYLPKAFANARRLEEGETKPVKKP